MSKAIAIPVVWCSSVRLVLVCFLSLCPVNVFMSIASTNSSFPHCDVKDRFGTRGYLRPNYRRSRNRLSIGSNLLLGKRNSLPVRNLIHQLNDKVFEGYALKGCSLYLTIICNRL